ncbi:hypothetical protein CVU37_04785 [candidate division BRC1 bacterium HGW-BRC1-1]|jgi:putative RecB family exonuclease|nr:MAG: hypothetical protein CVU37_04785 [candidate division BRC1 bacterium HGW-BRC1-1]
MSTALLQTEKGEPVATAPHLSYSRINRYLFCPEQYRLYYIENLRPRVPSASLCFGQTVHQALAHFFRGYGDPVHFFKEEWLRVQHEPIAYSYRESWDKLAERGVLLLQSFIRDELPKLGKIIASEKPFDLSISNLDSPFIGVIDLVAEIDGERTVIDFKTASQAYDDYEVVLSDQLTAYALAEPDAQQSALCVFVKTKEPRIDWYLAKRTSVQLAEFLAKASIVGQSIAAGHFYKRPGKQCGWCDYLPVCTGDLQATEQSLTRPDA